MADFFISYNKADANWAGGVAGWLHKAGYSSVMQEADFRPGCNFILEMDRAAKTAKRTIAILSPDYLTAQYTQPEWAAAFASDPTGQQRRLIPVRVRECALVGLLAQVVYIDLVGLTVEDARARLLEGIREREGGCDTKAGSVDPVPQNKRVGGQGVTIQGDVTSSIVGNTITIKQARRSSPRVQHPSGSIGADLDRKVYTQYLVRRFNEFKQADKSFGEVAKSQFKHEVIHTQIERKFKCKTYFIRVERFQELVDYLQGRIDGTILGKRNRARGTPNYQSFGDYTAEQKGEAGKT